VFCLKASMSPFLNQYVDKVPAAPLFSCQEMPVRAISKGNVRRTLVLQTR
jgi:hypothetical protein